jgi:C4-dicarboxylate-binding protein DctP
VYQALQTGVVDGGENTPSNVYTQKFHEVQKYVTVSEQTYIGYALIVNKKFWEGLPADIRGELDDAVREATAYCNTIAEQENAEALEKIKQSGHVEIITLSPEQKAEWLKGLLPVHQEMAARIGKDLIDAIYRETGVHATQ